MVLASVLYGKDGTPDHHGDFVITYKRGHKYE